MLAALVLWGCRSPGGSDTTRVTCQPGATQGCVGSNGCVGTRVCADTGEGYSECDCAGNSSGDVVLAGTGGTTTQPAADTDGDGAGDPPGTSGGPPMLGGGSERSCTPGARRSCVGESDCAGVQVCDALGVTFSACECATAMSIGRVAASCSSDADCGSGLTCELPSSINGVFSTGGPHGGYCTATCNTTDECRALDPLAACYAPGGVGPGPGYCLKTCSLEPGASATSCEGRSDLACTSPATDDPSFCYPVCNSDAECGDRYCSLFNGLCSPFPPEGQRVIGAACAQNRDCVSGWCISIAEQRRVCSGFCIYDSVGGCGYGEDAAKRGAACLNPRVPELSSEISQLGWCSQLCDVDQDCVLSTSGWRCEHWPPDAAAGLSAKWGRSGACIQPSTGACSDDCEYAFDGYCDDGGPDVYDPMYQLCELGTDCTDCGPRP